MRVLKKKNEKKNGMTGGEGALWNKDGPLHALTIYSWKSPFSSQHLTITIYSWRSPFSSQHLTIPHLEDAIISSSEGYTEDKWLEESSLKKCRTLTLTR